MAEVYEKLRERLDMFPQGYPKTKSGVEIEILEQLFTAEEAEIATSLKPYPEPVAAIAETGASLGFLLVGVGWCCCCYCHCHTAT